jgi:transposase
MRPGQSTRVHGLQSENHHRRGGVGDDAARDLRGRTDRRRHAYRLQRRPHRFAIAAYAAYTGTAPVEFSSGGRITHRLSRRGNRRLDHALHIAASTQIRNSHSVGRGYYDRKLADGDTARSDPLVRRLLSDIAWRHLVADAQRAARP